MADGERKTPRQTAKRPTIKYFFLNDELHRKLRISRGTDIISAWNYPQEKRKVYSYSYVLRRHKRAFTTTEVAKMVRKTKKTIDNAIRDGSIRMPQYTYGLESKKKFQYMWREEDIMELHEYLSSLHIGRPRNDGEITNNSIPSPVELRAMIREEGIVYVKHGDVYVPSWKAKEF